jgi:CheY-like chemotaxis protein
MTTLDPPIILIVDDDFINRFVLGKTLETLEQTYQECENGEDAINWLKATSHNHIVILLDLNMPIMDGYDFWSISKKIRENSSIRI